MKVALVTGANRGIGFEVCRQLVEKGFTVVLASRSKSDGVAAAKDIGCDCIQMDVSKDSSVSKAASAFKEKYKRLDVLVNNAGIFIDGSKSILNVDIDTVKKTMETNLYGPLRVTQAFYPFLKKSDDPRIINVSSGAGSLGEGGMGSGYPSYSISKTALNALTVSLSGTQMSVNSICPGWVKTRMGGSSAPRTVEQGADTVTWLATTKRKISGKFFRDREEIEW